MIDIKEKWLTEIGTPSYKVADGKMSLIKCYDYPEYTVEMYFQETGPDKVQKVSMAIPKNHSKPCPAVVVPFYHAEDMLGFNPETNEKIERFCDYPIMTDLAKRGYITISADAYPFQLLYKNKDIDLEGFAMWKYAAEILRKENPKWTGIGNLISDTKLLINALCNDSRVDSEKIGIMGHSLGGKMSFYTGCLDERIKVIVASDFGIRWDQTNWNDIWYWGDYVKTLEEKGMDHSQLLDIAGGIPFCLIAGEYDNNDSWEMMLKSTSYKENDEKLKIINHATGHKPPKDVLEESYKFIDKFLK